MIIVDLRLSANRGEGGAYMYDMSDQHRAEVCNLITAHGLDTMRCAALTYDVVDMPLLRFEMFADDENGDPMLNDAGDDIVRYNTERALRHPLPSWWKPAA